jgi:hypothetical protein
MTQSTDDKLDPKAKGRQTSADDFNRNREGLYGGLPKARDDEAPGARPADTHPPKSSSR